MGRIQPIAPTFMATLTSSTATGSMTHRGPRPSRPGAGLTGGRLADRSYAPTDRLMNAAAMPTTIAIMPHSAVTDGLRASSRRMSISRPQCAPSGRQPHRRAFRRRPRGRLSGRSFRRGVQRRVETNVDRRLPPDSKQLTTPMTRPQKIATPMIKAASAVQTSCTCLQAFMDARQNGPVTPNSLL